VEGFGEREVLEAISAFEPVWEHLLPAEQERMSTSLRCPVPVAQAQTALFGRSFSAEPRPRSPGESTARGHHRTRHTHTEARVAAPRPRSSCPTAQRLHGLLQRMPRARRPERCSARGDSSRRTVDQAGEVSEDTPSDHRTPRLRRHPDHCLPACGLTFHLSEAYLGPPPRAFRHTFTSLFRPSGGRGVRSCPDLNPDALCRLLVHGFVVSSESLWPCLVPI
jgi:hypothetical protein